MGFVELIQGQCGVPKSKGDWHQRICSIREVCWYIVCHSGTSGLDGVSVDDSDDCVQAMRELARSFAKLAQLPAAPDNRGRSSASSRKKFALMCEAVGDFIGSDVLCALLALAEPNTCHNLELLNLAVARGRELLLEIFRELERPAA